MELHTGKLARLFVYALLGAAAFSVAAPLALMILNSLRSNFDILISPLGWPSEPEWGVFVRVWKEAQLGQAIVNSLADDFGQIGPIFHVFVLSALRHNGFLAWGLRHRCLAAAFGL